MVRKSFIEKVEHSNSNSGFLMGWSLNFPRIVVDIPYMLVGVLMQTGAWCTRTGLRTCAVSEPLLLR